MTAEDKGRPITALAEFVRNATLTHDKGREMRGKTVDVHFMQISFTELAADQDQFKQVLSAAMAAPGEFADIGAERMAGGPSYIEIGAWVGDQGDALRLLGLGELCGLWEVVTPAKLGITGPEADQLAGSGFVLAAPTADFANLVQA